ncbi:hypothetical protein N6H14_28800 [Paenibacillus sp. CC-CFT747]|nr:hypothetical protein N6H14_28800 [Paenibacillus sp. CC-CFT747]
MKVKEARRTASAWVKEAAAPHEEFVGAYLSGSTVDLTEDADLPPASDVDIMVVTSREEPPGKLGKFLYQGALLEVTHLPLNRLASAESVLADYHLAGGFRRDTVIADPSGWLREIQRDVSRQFADRHWVRQRCLQALNKIRTGVQGLDPDASLPDLVNSWLFPAGITTHVLLAAALRNPTVRLRYPAANAVLREFGLEAVYPELIKLLGCEAWTPHQASTHLEALSLTFDTAAAVSARGSPSAPTSRPRLGRSPSTAAGS